MLLRELVSPNDEQDLFRPFGEDTSRPGPAELPAPATITVEPRQSWPSNAVAA